MDEYVALYSSQVEILYNYEIPVIRDLQKVVDEQNMGPTLQFVSRLGSPELAFTLAFPLLYALHWSVGIRFLGVAIVSEWLNMILKWLLQGERPYWYVFESANFTKVAKTYFVQNPETCETGPGSPSGHVMANVVLFVVLCDALNEWVVKRMFAATPPNGMSASRVVGNRMVWNLLLIWQALVSFSRVYNLSHFPHQCALGWVFGLLVVQLFYHNNNSWTRCRSRVKLCLCAAFFLASAGGVYYSLVQNGINPDWSIEKALKWCKKRQWVKVDTTPFYTLMRLSGSAFGVAFALPTYMFRAEAASIGKENALPVNEQLVRALLGALLGFAAGLGQKVLPSTWDSTTLYSVEFCVVALYTYLAIVFVPVVSNLLFGRTIPVLKEEAEKKPKKKKKR